MIRGISHVTLSVKQLARSYRFYVDVLGCKPIAKWPKGAYLTAGNVWIALVVDRHTRSGPLPEYTHLAFRVPARSFHAFAKRIRASGAEVFQENVTEGKVALFSRSRRAQAGDPCRRSEIETCIGKEGAVEGTEVSCVGLPLAWTQRPGRASVKETSP